jgi:hypothetical protein
MTLPTIFPPSSLPTFHVDGHGIQLGANYAGVSRGRGHSRLRPKSSGAHRIVSVQWRLTQAQMTDLDLWFEQTLNVGVEQFTAEVANQGPGRLFWRAVWAEPYVAVPQPTPEGVFWTVTGRILLTGTGEATRPTTGDLSAEIEVALLGAGTLVLPETPLATEITVALEVITALRAEITVALLSSTTPLSAEITVALLGSGALSAGSSGTSYTLTVEEVDGSPSQVDPTKLVFPNGSLTVDSDGEVIVALSGLTIEEEDAGPSTSPSKLIFPDGTLTVDSDGNVHYTPDENPLTIEEVDGNPSLTSPTKLIFPNGTLTTDTDGNVTYTPTVGGSLLYWAESQDTAAPNGSINAATFTALSGGSSGSAIIQWKGVSGFLAVQVPDNTSTGGNLRGIRAIDFQSSRASASQVASGANSALIGTTNCTASGSSNAVAIAGSTVTSSANQSLGQGTQITADGDNCVVIGAYASARGLQSFVQGSGSSTIGRRQRVSFVGFTSSAFSAAARTLSTTGAAADGTNTPILPNNSVFGFTARILMLGGSDYWDAEVKGTCYRGANAAATVINGVTTAIAVTDIYKTAGVAGLGWAMSAIADTTNGGIIIRTTGDTGQLVNSSCYVDMIQLTP